MKEQDFFEGERKQNSWVLDLHGGKVRFECTVVDHWQQILSFVLRCGDKLSHTIRRHVGVSVTDRKEFEGAINASLGIKGIAELNSELKATQGTELRWEGWEEEERTFVFEAPKCGRKVCQVYQLYRAYRFKYLDKRFLHRGDWSKEIEERLNYTWDDSRDVPFDPACGCPAQSEIPSERLLRLLSDSFSMVVACREGDKGLDFTTAGLSTLKSTVKAILSSRGVRLRNANIPTYLRFLAHETRSELNCRFVPYSEAEGELWKGGYALPEVGIPGESFIFLRRENRKLQRQAARLEQVLQRRSEQLRILEGLTVELQRECSKLKLRQSPPPRAAGTAG